MTKMDQYRELHSLLLSKSTSANITPVLHTGDGQEIPLTPEAISVLNSILEQAFIPFICDVLIKEGYHKDEETTE